MKRLKSFICSVVLAVLFRALRFLNRKDSRMRAQFSNYTDGCRFCIRAGMEPGSPCLSFCIHRGYLIACSDRNADLEITFKSIHDAFLVFTGQLGIGAAYAEHRFFMRGNPNEAMELVSCMELAEAYLFPRILSRRLMLRVPRKEFPSLLVYLSLLAPVSKPHRPR